MSQFQMTRYKSLQANYAFDPFIPKGLRYSLLCSLSNARWHSKSCSKSAQESRLRGCRNRSLKIQNQFESNMSKSNLSGVESPCA